MVFFVFIEVTRTGEDINIPNIYFKKQFILEYTNYSKEQALSYVKKLKQYHNVNYYEVELEDYKNNKVEMKYNEVFMKIIPIKMRIVIQKIKSN